MAKKPKGALTESQRAEILETAFSEAEDIADIVRDALSDVECAGTVETTSDWTDNLAEAEDKLKRALRAIADARDTVRAQILELGRSDD